MSSTRPRTASRRGRPLQPGLDGPARSAPHSGWAGPVLCGRSCARQTGECPHLQQRSPRPKRAADRTAESCGSMSARRGREQPLSPIWTRRRSTAPEAATKTSTCQARGARSDVHKAALSRSTGTFHEPEGIPLPPGTSCACRDRSPVPARANCTRPHRNVPDCVDRPRPYETAPARVECPRPECYAPVDGTPADHKPQAGQDNSTIGLTGPHHPGETTR